MNQPVKLDGERIADFCQRNHIAWLALFGSVLREDYAPESDVDVLVEFKGDAVITLLDMARMETELTEIIGRKFDLRTPQELSRYFRDQVLASAVVQYAA